MESVKHPSSRAKVKRCLVMMMVLMVLSGCARIEKVVVRILPEPLIPFRSTPHGPPIPPLEEQPPVVAEPQIQPPVGEVSTPGWHYNILATRFDISRFRRPSFAWNDVNPLAENPYHVALPVNNMLPGQESFGPCKNRWIEIVAVNTGKRAFGQWLDVGPWFVNDSDYVFDETGTVRPFAENSIGKRLNRFRQSSGARGNRPRKILNGSGIDLSPELANNLGIDGTGLIHWRFAEEHEVSEGPWLRKVSKSPPRYR